MKITTFLFALVLVVLCATLTMSANSRVTLQRIQRSAGNHSTLVQPAEAVHFKPAVVLKTPCMRGDPCWNEAHKAMEDQVKRFDGQYTQEELDAKADNEHLQGPKIETEAIGTVHPEKAPEADKTTDVEPVDSTDYTHKCLGERTEAGLTDNIHDSTTSHCSSPSSEKIEVETK